MKMGIDGNMVNYVKHSPVYLKTKPIQYTVSPLNHEVPKGSLREIGVKFFAWGGK